MSGKKPRKPRPISLNPFERAAQGARKLDAVHVENISAMIEDAWMWICKGEQHTRALYDLAFASNVAAELSDIGICSDTASKDKTIEAQKVITVYAGQAADFSRLTISDEDIHTMAEAIFIWKTQLSFVSLSEFERARHKVNIALEEARRGVVGRNTVIKLSESVE